MLTLTERNGFVRQADRFNKRLATDDVSSYKHIKRDDFAFNPYLLWAGAIARNRSFDSGVISPLYPTFRASPGHCPGYVERLVLSETLISAYDKIAYGSVPRRRRSSVKDFLNLEVPTPPTLREQERIAAILDRADELSAKRRQAIAHLDALTQSIFHSMFGQPADSWPQMTVEEVADPQKGAIRTGPFGSQLLTSEFTEHGVAVLGIDNAVTNRFAWGQRRYISEEKYRKLERYRVWPGDLLITIMGTLGRCAVVPSDIPRAINTKHLCCVTVNEKLIVSEWLHAHFLQSNEARMYLRQTTKGAIMGGLNMGIVKKMPVRVPPIELQRVFATRVAAVERLKETHQKHLAKLDALFASLQSRAFKGEL
ncbi:restriction endonuclease subunit S [Paenarthrobacter sp. NCHU4564]|uniref:restriction endonuclease subunit S n=1 Tax=Paenarthrobacter sp. NCHU4564 TaxID=3451353 RepID=UPI003F995390